MNDLRNVHIPGDLAMVNGRFVFSVGTDEATRLRAIAQKIRARFQMFLGEWFLDVTLGVPFYRDIFVKNPDMVVVRSVFRRVLLSVPQVTEIEEFEVAFNRPTRHLSFEHVVRVDVGNATLADAFRLET